MDDSVWTNGHDQERKDRLAECRSIIDRAKSEKRNLTKDEKLTLDAHRRRVDHMLSKIPMPRQTEPDRLGGASHRDDTPIRGGRLYRQMFGGRGLSADGWDSFDDYLEAVHSGLHHPLLCHGARKTSHLGAR